MGKYKDINKYRSLNLIHFNMDSSLKFIDF